MADVYCASCSHWLTRLPTQTPDEVRARHEAACNGANPDPTLLALSDELDATWADLSAFYR